MSSYILRTWQCQNTACTQVFDAHARYPSCPRCGCVRVAWVPGKVNLGSASTKFADDTLKDLAAAYGLSDLNSPSPSRQLQAKVMETPKRNGAGGVVNFRGFAASIDPEAARSATNQSGAQCVPTVNRIDAKVKAGMDQAMTGQLGVKSIAANTQVVGHAK